MAQARGRLLGRRRSPRAAGRVPRPARVPAARARPPRRRLGRRVRDAARSTSSARSSQREVEPGELVVIDEDGRALRRRPCRRQAPRRALHLRVLLPRAPRLDDSTASRSTAPACAWASGSPARRPVDADLVMPIPDSGTPAAIGFARESGIPFGEGLIKNRYVGRTFIQPEQGMREQGIRMKFNPLDGRRRQARRHRRRLDRARHHHAPDRRDAVRRRARPRCTSASRRRRSSRRASTASTSPTRTSSSRPTASSRKCAS